MEKFLQLRNKHKEFVYHDFEISETGFKFHFSIDEYNFYPSWSFSEGTIGQHVNRDLLEYAVFSLGMAELVSYWKCACPPVVRIKCGALDQQRIQWWKKLYFNGLGEFFYRNEIKTDVESFMTVIADNGDVPVFNEQYQGDGFLIPVGGGKDSVVTLELLRDYHSKNLCYIINPRGATVGCANAAGYNEGQILGVGRTIDKQLLELNKMGYLNGHTPLSAVIAFSGWIFAYCTGRRYVALSNESSANEANIEGTKINHQYSKSTEFESDFRQYTSNCFGAYPEYFSLLRPWSEWQIAKKFVQYPQYFPVFQSCNVGSKTNVWCANCAKCLYVYIMLAAFLDDEQLISIFGKNMLDDEQYVDLFNGLVYQNYDKPFECVGTKAEINLALHTAKKLRKNDSMPLLLARYQPENGSEPQNLDLFFDENNYVPDFLIPLLRG